MRITKYPQSCLVLEDSGRRLLIDLGTIATEKYDLDRIGDVDAVLYTHQHFDHLDESKVGPLLDGGAQVFANADVVERIGDDRVVMVSDGETFEAAGYEVTARDLPHVEMVDGSPGPPNTGFLIDGTFFHPGDGIELAGLEVDHLALPIAGPSVSFRDAYKFTESTGANVVLPIHYDFFLASPQRFSEFCDIAEVLILDHGESAEL